MSYFEILKEAIATYSWFDLYRLLGVWAFGISSGMCLRFVFFDLKAKIPFVALAMFILSLMLMFFAIISGSPFFTYPAIEVRITSFIILIIFVFCGCKWMKFPQHKKE